MIIDNIDYFSSSKLSKIIEERFGQSINLNELEDTTLETFKGSVQNSVKNFESAMAFNTGASNPKYVENKLLLDAIIKEQEMRIKKVQGDEIEIEDPDGKVPDNSIFNIQVQPFIDTSNDAGALLKEAGQLVWFNYRKNKLEEIFGQYHD